MFHFIFFNHWPSLMYFKTRSFKFSLKWHFKGLFCVSENCGKKLASVSCQPGVCLYCFSCIIDNMFYTFFAYVYYAHTSHDDVNQKVVGKCWIYCDEYFWQFWQYTLSVKKLLGWYPNICTLVVEKLFRPPIKSL